MHIDADTILLIAIKTCN